MQCKHGRLGARGNLSFAGMQRDMPHAEKRGDAYAAANENAVAISCQKAITEMTVGGAVQYVLLLSAQPFQDYCDHCSINQDTLVTCHIKIQSLFL